MSCQEESPLHLPADQLRRLGYQIVDLMVDHHATLRDKPASRIGDWDVLNRSLRKPFPARGSNPEALLKTITEEILDNAMLSNHPRFMAFIPSPAHLASAFIEGLVAAYNPFLGAWHEASGPTVVELAVVDWLARQIGFSSAAGGVVTSGGTAASLAGLAAARRHKLGDDCAKGVAYLSTQTHGTVVRNLRLLGIGTDRVRRLEVDPSGAMRVDSLRQAIARDRGAGLTPFCVVGTAGTTNTGAVDPFPALVELCRREGLWLHVDAAFGGAALLSREGKRLLDGLSEADTVVIDAHKWLFQPFEFGCLVARDKELLKETFAMEADYTDDLAEGLNMSDYGIQLSRSFKALKLWFTLHMFGEECFVSAVERGLENGRRLEALLAERPRWEVVTPSQLSIVTFRHRDLDDEQHRALVQECWRDGTAVISSTVWQDRVVLRACPINPGLTAEDLVMTLEALERLAARVGVPAG